MAAEHNTLLLDDDVLENSCPFRKLAKQFGVALGVESPNARLASNFNWNSIINDSGGCPLCSRLGVAVLTNCVLVPKEITLDGDDHSLTQRIKLVSGVRRGSRSTCASSGI